MSIFAPMSQGTERKQVHGEYVMTLDDIQPEPVSRFTLEKARLSPEQAVDIQASAKHRIEKERERAWDVCEDLAAQNGTDAKTVMAIYRGRLKFLFTIDEVLEIDKYPTEVNEKDDAAVAAFEDTLIDYEHYEWCNNTMGANATLRAWLQGMLGRNLTKDDDLDPAQFIRRQYKVQLGDVTYESGPKFTIKTIKPYKAKPARAARTRQPDPEGFDDDEDPNTIQYDENGNKLKF